VMALTVGIAEDVMNKSSANKNQKGRRDCRSTASIVSLQQSCISSLVMFLGCLLRLNWAEDFGLDGVFNMYYQVAS